MRKNPMHRMNLFTLVMVSSAFVTSVRNLPTIAESGTHMIFFALVAAICYFIPVALVSAELATGWPKKGGVYVWVREAFGDRFGFVAIWLQWTYMIIGVVSMLYFVSGALAYIVGGHLAQDKWFLAIINLVVVWVFTYLSLHGQKISSMISTVGFIVGVAIPAVLIIALGVVYVVQGDPMQIHFTWSRQALLPDFGHLTTWVFLVGMMRAFVGVEASAAHANAVNNPNRNFPIAILLVVIIGLLVNGVGSFAVATVVPQKSISLVGGLFEAFEVFLGHFHMDWLVPILAFMVLLGALGGINTWMNGPVRGILATAEYGEIPPVLQTVNNNHAPSHLLWIQAVLISVISCGFLLMPNINIAFWISVALSIMIYTIMYFMMLLSGLYLRYRSPNVPRAYKVPFGKPGIWFVSCLGMLTMIFIFIVALFPPKGLQSGNHDVYFSILTIGIIVLVAIPFVIYHNRLPSWKRRVDLED